VKRYNGSQIDRSQDIAVEHDRGGIDVLFRILECAACAERRAFDGIANPDAVIRAVLEQIFDLPGLIRQAENNLLNPRASHQIDLVEEKRRVCNGNDRLWSVDRQRPKPGTFATGENESLHISFLY
jgi:hypothetical protein